MYRDNGVVTGLGQRAFTLVELLIAISLLGLISVSTYGVVWTVNRSLNAVEQRVEYNDELRTVQEFFRSSLTQARGTMVVVDEKMQHLFTGDAHSLSFVAPAPLQRGSAGGLYYYHYEFGGAGSARSLRLSYTQFFAVLEFDEMPPVQGESLLLEDVVSLSFSYYGFDEPGGEARWLSEWQRKGMLPQLVRLKLQLASSDEVSVLTVAIKGQLG